MAGSFVCSECGSVAEVVKGNYEFRESGVNRVFLHGIDLITCKDCGNVDPVIPNIKGLLKVIATTIVNKPARLSGAEVRFLRKWLGLTGEQLGAVISSDKATISRWENETTAMGEHTERLLRAVVLLVQNEGPEALKRFEQITSSKKPMSIAIDPSSMVAEYTAA